MNFRNAFMKVILLVCLSFFALQSANSQIIISLLLGDKLNSESLEFGVEGGFARSWMTGIDHTKGLGSLHLGFYFDFRLKNSWYLNTGVSLAHGLSSCHLCAFHRLLPILVIR